MSGNRHGCYADAAGVGCYSAARAQFVCHNLGGPGRFRVVAEQDFPDDVALPDDLDYLPLPPFTFMPEEFELPSESCITVQVVFSPESQGELSRELFMLCDNVQIKKFVLTGAAPQATSACARA